MSSGVTPRDRSATRLRQSSPDTGADEPARALATGPSASEVVETLDLRPVPADQDLQATLRPARAPRRPRSSRLPSAPPTKRAFEGSGTTVRIKGSLGEGGMGVVHLAEQGALLREVAAKTLRDEFLNDEFIERLVREARITGLVEHPNIVPVYALTLDERGAPLMLMKRIEGVSWREMLRAPDHEAFPEDADDRLGWHLGVLMEVCDAVAYAHSRGILHLDLKPSNVMVGAFREVYVVDWGVAVSTRDEHRGVLPVVDELDEVLGTPAYLAPEMIDPEGALRLDQRTDIYLLGAVLFEVLTGRPPHVGRDLHESLCRAYEAEVPALPSTVPRELVSIVERALARDPEQRFQSVEELRRAIKGFLRHRSSAALVDSALPQLLRLRRLVESGGGDTAEVQRIFGGCRFAFAQALESWAENPRAREGLAETQLLLARHHTEHGDPQTAIAVLDAIDEPSAEIAEAIAEVRAQASQRAVHRQSIARFSQEHDASRGRVARARFFLGLAIVLNLPNFAAWAFSQFGLFELTWWTTWFFTAALTGITVVGALMAHQEMAPNRVGRQIMWQLTVMGFLVMATRILTLELGLPLRQGLSIDVLVFGAGCASIGVLRDRLFWAGAIGFWIAVPLIVYVPVHATLWISLSGIAGPAFISGMWLRAERRRERGHG